MGLWVFGAQVWMKISVIPSVLCVCLIKKRRSHNSTPFFFFPFPPLHEALLTFKLLKTTKNSIMPVSPGLWDWTEENLLVWMSRARHERQLCGFKLFLWHCGSFVSGVPPACDRSSETRWWRFCNVSRVAVLCCVHVAISEVMTITPPFSIAACKE